MLTNYTFFDMQFNISIDIQNNPSTTFDIKTIFKFNTINSLNSHKKTGRLYNDLVKYRCILRRKS